MVETNTTGSQQLSETEAVHDDVPTIHTKKDGSDQLHELLHAMSKRHVDIVSSGKMPWTQESVSPVIDVTETDAQDAIEAYDAGIITAESMQKTLAGHGDTLEIEKVAD